MRKAGPSTPGAKPPWSRSSARSRRPEAFAVSPSAAPVRWRRNGSLSISPTTCSSYFGREWGLGSVRSGEDPSSNRPKDAGSEPAPFASSPLRRRPHDGYVRPLLCHRKTLKAAGLRRQYPDGLLATIQSLTNQIFVDLGHSRAPRTPVPLTRCHAGHRRSAHQRRSRAVGHRAPSSPRTIRARRTGIVTDPRLERVPLEVGGAGGRPHEHEVAVRVRECCRKNDRASLRARPEGGRAGTPSKIDASNVLVSLSLSPGGFFLVSCHGEENVDSARLFLPLVALLLRLPTEYGLPVIVSTHPRTRKRLEAEGVCAGPGRRWSRWFATPTASRCGHGTSSWTSPAASRSCDSVTIDYAVFSPTSRFGRKRDEVLGVPLLVRSQ